MYECRGKLPMSLEFLETLFALFFGPKFLDVVVIAVIVAETMQKNKIIFDDMFDLLHSYLARK